MRISDWSSDVFSSDLQQHQPRRGASGLGLVFEEVHLRAGIGDSEFGIRKNGCAAIGNRRLHPHGTPTQHRPCESQIPNPESPPFRTQPSARTEEHTSELQSLMLNSYAVISLKQNINGNINQKR